MKRLELSENEFQEVMAQPTKFYTDYQHKKRFELLGHSLLRLVPLNLFQ